MHLNILFQPYLMQSMPKLVISKVNSVSLLLQHRVNRSHPPVYRILLFRGVATLSAEAFFPCHSLEQAGGKKTLFSSLPAPLLAGYGVTERKKEFFDESELVKSKYSDKCS